MSVSPISRTITPASIVKSTFGSKKKKLILGAKIGSKGMKCFTINTSLSKHNTKPTDRNKSSRSGISNGSIHRSSGKDLEKVSSLLNKLKEVNTIKEKLAIHNQTLKFKVAELQKEKYSLSQLNKKLSEEVQKCRIQDQGVVILKKKDFNTFLHNYYNMSEELEQMNALYSEICNNAGTRNELADRYLQNALEAEESLRQFRIK